MPTTTDILLIDDNVVDIRLTLYALRRCQYAPRVEVVRTGRAALAMLLSAEWYGGHTSALPRLVLLDLHLSDMYGTDVLRHIKADAQAGQVPVAMVSSSAYEHDIAESTAIGACAYILKSFEMERFQHDLLRLCHFWRPPNQGCCHWNK